MDRPVNQSCSQSKVLRDIAVGMAILCIAIFQTHAAGDPAGQQECATTIRPLVVQVEFAGTDKKIGTRFVQKKFLDELDEYIREMSHNRVCVKGEIAPKWYPLKPIAGYFVPWQNLQVNRVNLRNLVRDALNAVDEDVDVSKYDLLILALGANFREWGNHGVAVYPGMLGWRSEEPLYARSGRRVKHGIVAYAYTVQRGHVFHDVAHVLGGVKDGKRGLPCLYDQDKESSSTATTGHAVQEAFTDAQINMGGWDTMSCNSCLQRPGPPGISSWTRLRLGWLPPSKVRVVNPGETAQVTLGPLADASSATMAIRIPVSPTTYYLVENRQHVGFDKNLPEPGVLIMYADDTIPESRHGRAPVRLIDANPTVARLEGAAFDIGKNASFADEKNGIQIKLVSKNGDAYDILVERVRQDGPPGKAP